MQYERLQRSKVVLILVVIPIMKIRMSRCNLRVGRYQIFIRVPRVVAPVAWYFKESKGDDRGNMIEERTVCNTDSYMHATI